nr:hypothetical protein Iba_chr10cCG5070 [Ipomoea batatas]
MDELKMIYLIVYELSPETSQGSLVRIFGQNGSSRKGLIDILENDKRLSYWVSVVQEHRNFLVDRIAFENPETSHGFLIRIFRQNGSARESLVDILDDDERLSPETSHGFLIRIFRQNGSAREGLIDILDDDERLRVGFEKQGALVGEILLYEFIFNSFEFESNLNICAKRTCPVTEDLHFCHYLSIAQAYVQGFINDAPAMFPNSPSPSLVPSSFVTGYSSIDCGNHTFSRQVFRMVPSTDLLLEFTGEKQFQLERRTRRGLGEYSVNKTSHGFLIRIFRQNGSARKGLVDILDDDERLRYWVSVVQEDRNFLVDRVGFEKQGALVGQIFLYEFIFNSFEFESNLNICAKRACPVT